MDPLERAGGQKVFMSFQSTPKMIEDLTSLAAKSGITRSQYCRMCLHQAIEEGRVYRSRQVTIIDGFECVKMSKAVSALKRQRR